MAELTQKAGLPRPEIEEQVRFRPSKYIPLQQVKQNLTERQRKIL
jgi:ATP-dependent DNA helicase RecG